MPLIFLVKFVNQGGQWLFMLLRKKSTYAGCDYLRLSRDDGDKAESDSIHNQRELINDFLAKHPEIKKVQEYVDDGYSGTNFDRPNFKRMMAEIEKGRIDCVIVKDLSRLGRNYIEMGKYLERTFPMYGVRVIAINDNYDSANESSDADQIVIPFKNLINDAYCRDLSMKIRSQLDVKRKNGQFIGSFATYGYMKDPENKNHLIIDEYAANVVRMIFNMKLEGYSAGTISKHLNENRILTPMEYKRFCGLNFNGGFQISTNPIWHPNTVTRILKNEVLTGTAVQGKNRKINYKVKESRPVAESDWIRVPDSHEAIIPKQVFDTVQNLLLLDTRTAPESEQVDIFSGLIRCGDCGQNMVRRCSNKKGKKYYYYHCTTYKNGRGCTAHLISVDKLYEYVLWQIQDQIEKLAVAEKVMKAADNIPAEQFQVKSINQQLCALSAEIDRYKDLKEKLYQDMVDQVVSKDEYKELHVRFSRKIGEAEKAKTELEQQKNKFIQSGFRNQQWIEDFKQYRNIQTLDRKIVIALIDRIIVYDKNRVEIRFNYMDEMQMLIEAAEAYQEKTDKRAAI